MKNIFLTIIFNVLVTTFNYAQEAGTNNNLEQDIYSLIDKYSQAREKNDTVLLKSILTAEVDQLVSSGEWRKGIDASIKGMLRSSENNPGTRQIKIEKMRFINSDFGIVDARYEIKNTDGTERNMWSTFIVVYDVGMWKITAIRNMLPSRQQ